MPVTVVTDSNAHLAPEFVESLSIRVVPLHLLVGGADLREGVDDIGTIAPEVSVTTSGPSPGELKETYFEALKASGGDGVLAVHLSRQLSGTWNTAVQAATEFETKIRVVDSGTAGMGTGYVALAAARAAARGASLDEVHDVAVGAAERETALLYVDRLDSLRRSGRIGAAAAFLSTALSMRPVLQMDRGRMTLREKTRTASKAVTKLVDLAVQAAGDEPAALGVQHWYAPERAADVCARLRERVPAITEMHCSEYGPVLGTHLGPGAVGVVVCAGGADGAAPDGSYAS